MEEIKKWLDMENPDFDQGFTLFKKYCPNLSLISYIGRKKHFEMLTYQLSKLINSGVALKVSRREQKEVSTEKNKNRVDISDERHVKREDLPEIMRNLYDRNVEEYKEIRALHEKMKQANSETGRAEFRDQIIKINKKIKRRWEIIDSGELPEEKKMKSSDINSARAYISKMMKKEQLTEKQRELIKEKYDLIISSGEALKPETLKKLEENGF